MIARRKCSTLLEGVIRDSVYHVAVAVASVPGIAPSLSGCGYIYPIVYHRVVFSIFGYEVLILLTLVRINSTVWVDFCRVIEWRRRRASSDIDVFGIRSTVLFCVFFPLSNTLPNRPSGFLVFVDQCSHHDVLWCGRWALVRPHVEEVPRRCRARLSLPRLTIPRLSV